MSQSDRNHRNPLASNTPQVRRHGPETARPLGQYRAGETHDAVMAAPAAPAQCVMVGRHARCEFTIVPPAGVASFRAVVGRWSTNKIALKQLDAGDPVTGDGYDAWEDETEEWGTGTIRMEVETLMDPVGIYVPEYTGTISSGGFRFFFRGA